MGGDKTPRPKASGARKHAKQDITGTQQGMGRGKEKGKKTKTPTTATNGATPAQRGPNKQRGHQEQPEEGWAHQNAPRRPACPTRPRRARTHTHAEPRRGVFRPKRGGVSVHTKQHGAPAESPVERRTVRKTGRVSDRVHTRRTTAAHAAQDRSWRDPPGTTPSRGPEQVRHGAGPAPLPRRGPAANTMSPVLSRPPRAQRSHPVMPGATAPGVGEGTMATGKPTGAPRATGPDEERRTNAGPRGMPDRHAAGHNHGTRTGAKPQR